MTRLANSTTADIRLNDRGHPLEQYYRAKKLAPDSNFDGVKDWQEYASEIVLVPWSQSNPDNDYTYDSSHLVPNAYFSDSTTRRFGNLIINEVWFDARTTPAVPPSQLAADGIELYNPTSASITINNWKLEATKSGVTTTWNFPATPAISVPSGGFRVITASGIGTYPHASFSLEGSTLQSIQLKNATSVLVDQFVLASVPGATAHSQPFDCARWLGNPTQWVVPFGKSGTLNQHNQIIARPLAQNTLDPAGVIPNAYYGKFTNPIINEAQFASTGEPVSGDGESHDWIEIYNPTSATVSLQGWSLRDNKSPLTKVWTFPTDSARPDLSIAPNAYKVIYCSGKSSMQVDNTEAASVILTGSWTTATAGTAYLGTNYLHDGNTGKGTKNVQFAPSLPATGHYWVYLRWPTTTGGAGGIPVDIKSLAGTDTVNVYQQSGSGPWFPLGEFDFAAGRNAATGSVTVRTTGTSGLVFADAVLFSPFPVSELHATFKLDLDFPSTLDLRNASATVVNTLAAPSFGAPPTAGVSVGMWPDRLGATPAAALTFRYFTTPTPGADNSMAPDPATLLSPSPEFVTPGGTTLTGGIFYNTTVQVALRCLAAPDAFIFYTTNGAEPTDRSEIYTAPLSLTGTAIIRAVAIRPGGLPSRPITASFLFKESVLGTAAQGATTIDHQGALDPQNNLFGLLYGYPRFTGESRDASLGGGVYEFDYAMNGADIALYKNAMVTELSALPTISLVTTVNDGFNPEADGVFAHSSDSTLEVAGSVEFIGFSGQPHLRENCGIEIAGGSSRSEGQTPKHSLELQFRKSYSLTGDGKLTANIFPTIPFDQGRTVTKFDKLRLRTPLQNSWPIRGEGDSTFSGDPAVSTYCNEQWGRDTQAGMGHLTPRMRWTHVYLHGIYWGVYALSEVVTQDFLSEHNKSRNNVSGEAALQFAENNYDVIGGGGRVQQGDPQAEYDWQNLRNETNYAVVEQQVDIDNYIDYLIANFFMVNRDWEDNDWRASRNRHPSAPDHKWRFYVWDCDGAFQQEYAGTAGLKNQHFDVASIHDNFRYYPPYQRKLTAHLKQHLLDTGGAFSPSGASFNSVIKYQTAMTAFQAGLYSESSRWGDVNLPAPRTTSFGFTDWQTNTSLVVNAFLPAQRTAFLSDAPDFGLLVSPSVNALNQGPEVTLTVPGGTAQPFSGGIAPLNSVLTLSAPSKSIRYILDFEGSNRDPKSGGAASITSQKTWTLDQTLKDDYGSIEISARTLTSSVWSGLTRIQIEIQ